MAAPTHEVLVTPTVWLAITLISIYGVALVLCLVLGVVTVLWGCRGGPGRPSRWRIVTTANVFFFAASWCLAARFTWSILISPWVHVDTVVIVAINRVSTCLFVTAISVVVAEWAENIHKRYVVSEKFLGSVQLIWVAFVLLVYVFFAISISVTALLDTRDDISRRTFFIFNFVSFGTIELLMSACVLIYGILSLRSLNLKENFFNLVQIFVASLVFIFCAVLRLAMLSFQLANEEFRQSWMLYVLVFVVPDLLPLATASLVVWLSLQRRNATDNLISTLYDTNDAALYRGSSDAGALNRERTASELSDMDFRGQYDDYGYHPPTHLLTTQLLSSTPINDSPGY